VGDQIGVASTTGTTATRRVLLRGAPPRKHNGVAGFINGTGANGCSLLVLRTAD